MNPSRVLAITCLALIAATPVPSAGRKITYPTGSTPAFTLLLPAGWTSGNTASGALELKNADSTGVISMNVLANAADAVKVPYDDFAKQVFDASGIPKIDKKAATKFAGISAMAYFGSLSKPDGSVVNLKITIVHVDPTHLAVITRTTASGLGMPALAAVEKVIASAKLVPAK